MVLQDYCGIVDMQRSCCFSLLPLHQDPLLEVSSDTLTKDLMNWESPFRDPFHHNIAEQSAFCASLDTPEFLFEGSFLLFFLLPLLALVVLYISMGLTISRCKFTTSQEEVEYCIQVRESRCEEQLLQHAEERPTGNKSLFNLQI